jgi:dTDP-4-dehydrorhamnose 3,5-epimerase-like enzyme
MKVYNIYDNSEPKLGKSLDERGDIVDIFYNKSINHGCIINSKPYAVRGNHYHEKTTQYTYIISGSMTYAARELNSDSTSYLHVIPGDFIISEPNEIHAMKAGQDGCMFIAFAEGPRGGEDYETDTIKGFNLFV